LGFSFLPWNPHKIQVADASASGVSVLEGESVFLTVPDNEVMANSPYVYRNTDDGSVNLNANHRGNDNSNLGVPVSGVLE
jgi:hypothetical protein